MSPYNETQSASFSDVLADKDQIRKQRVDELERTVSSQLQDLLSQAAAAKSQSTKAKTATKRAFYQKKFDKITREAKHAIVALQQIQAIAKTHENDADA